MADLLSYALTSLDDVKESLGIASGNTASDNLIKRKINQATEMIEGYCNNRRFKETTYTGQEYDGSGTNQLILKNNPINTSEAFTLYIRDTRTNTNSWETIETDRYFIDSDAGLVEGLFTFYTHWNRYKVDYTAGYATIPADLAEACVILATYLTENSQTGTGVKRKQEGRRTIEYFDPKSSSNGQDSLFTQLNIDEILNRYANTPLLGDK